jgi:hypothetical protein
VSELEPTGFVARVVSVDDTQHISYETAHGRCDHASIGEGLRRARIDSRGKLRIFPGDFVRVGDRDIAFFRYPSPGSLNETQRSQILAAGFTLPEPTAAPPAPADDGPAVSWARTKMIERGIIRPGENVARQGVPGDPSQLGWVEKPTLRLDRFARQAIEAQGAPVSAPRDRKRAE